MTYFCTQGMRWVVRVNGLHEIALVGMMCTSIYTCNLDYFKGVIECSGLVPHT